MKGIVVLSGVAAGAIFTVLAACSSDKTTTVIVPLESGTADAGGNANANAKYPDGGTNCAALQDQDSCGSCCRDQETDASVKYVEYVVACYCQAGSGDGGTAFCATECADTFCNPKTPQDPAPGSPCDQCITAKNEQCAEQVNPLCEADPGCVPVLQCLSDSDCQDKPTL